nr:disks large homolog 5-like [Meriones unguiculatus]
MPYPRSNPFYEILKTQHKRVILKLKTVEQEHAEASQNLKDLDKETGFYRNLHSWLLMEQIQLKNKMDMMKQDNEMAQENWVLLKHQLAEMQEMCKDQEENTSDHQTPQLDKERERLEKLLQYLRKQTQLAIQERDLAIKMQHQFEDIRMRSEKLLLEMEVATAHEKSLLQKELLHQEPPAEPQPQETLNSWKELSYTEWVSSV